MKHLLKDNLVLVIGLALPALLMIGFMIAASLPNIVSDPPQHDLIFATRDNNHDDLPVTLKLTVDQDGALQAQITPAREGRNGSWKKLYRYEAHSQLVRELPLPYPANMDNITEVTTFTVGATKGLKIDTATTAPDGYALSYTGYSRSGLISELFIGSRYHDGPRLRKGRHSVRMVPTGERTYFYYGSIELVGWVVDQ